MDLIELASEVERAAHPDTELGRRVLSACGLDPGGSNPLESLDAALTLIAPDHWWMIGKGKCTDEEPMYGAQILGAFADGKVIAEADNDTSAALALCAAALRARAREGE